MKPSTFITAFVLLGFALLGSSYATETTHPKSALMKAPPSLNTAQKISRNTEIENIQRSGDKVSGGWQETATDGSWRHVSFVLSGNGAAVTFGDGVNGRRLPSVTRYTYIGPGSKNAKLNKSHAVYSEVHVAPDASPQFLTKANQSSLVPSEVATRVRGFGGDVKVLQQLADLKRISELGSGFDAARGAAAGKGALFGDRPAGAPSRSAGGWKDPRAGVGRDGRASDAGDEVISSDASSDANGRRSHSVTRHSDGSKTEVSSEVNNDGSSRSSRTDTDQNGIATSVRDEETDSHGNSTVVVMTYDTSSRTIRNTASGKGADGSWNSHTQSSHTTPSETPYSGRAGFDQAWMDKSMPWFMDALYGAWKRESDLVQSGGRIAQPGRGEGSSPGTRETPRVGSDAVTNCGDSGTSPCIRPGGTSVDVRGRMGGLSQPGRGDPNGGPGGVAIPERAPIPLPKK